MSQATIVLATALSGYGLFELFLMAVTAHKERRPCVILQIAAGFGFCLWVVIDKSLSSWPVVLGLAFIVADRLQTRLLKKNG
jgi:hypothetical protein